MFRTSPSKLVRQQACGTWVNKQFCFRQLGGKWHTGKKQQRQIKSVLVRETVHHAKRREARFAFVLFQFADGLIKQHHIKMGFYDLFTCGLHRIQKLFNQPGIDLVFRRKPGKAVDLFVAAFQACFYFLLARHINKLVGDVRKRQVVSHRVNQGNRKAGLGMAACGLQFRWQMRIIAQAQNLHKLVHHPQPVPEIYPSQQRVVLS